MKAGVQTVVLFALLASANGQTTPRKRVHVSGQATDTCGLSLVNALVTIRLPTGEVATARVVQDGEFDTTVIPPGIYTLQIDTPGAEVFSQTVDVSEGNVDLRVVAETRLVNCPTTSPRLSVQRSLASQVLDSGGSHSVFLPTVDERGGNIYFIAKDGHTIQLTSSGLDSSPSLSRDNRLVVFLREKYVVGIVHSQREVSDKELWIASTSREQASRKLLVGNPGLGEFRRPQFSLDGKRVCFEARSWATDYSMWVVEVATRKRSHSQAETCQ